MIKSKTIEYHLIEYTYSRAEDRQGSCRMLGCFFYLSAPPSQLCLCIPYLWVGCGSRSFLILSFHVFHIVSSHTSEYCCYFHAYSEKSLYLKLFIFQFIKYLFLRDYHLYFLLEVTNEVFYLTLFDLLELTAEEAFIKSVQSGNELAEQVFNFHTISSSFIPFFVEVYVTGFI